MASVPILTVFLVCYNRKAMAVQALRSIIEQSTSAVQIVVSDNSTQDGLAEEIESAGLGGVDFRRRQPSLSAMEHFNACVTEVETPYFMLFHDDDLLLPGALNCILETVIKNPSIHAVGINAIIERQGVQAGVSFTAAEPIVRIADSKALLRCYFGKGNLGIAPLPGYTFSVRVREQCRFFADEGKYSDVAFLMRVAALGSMVWINEPLMLYRLHDGNDSNLESRRDRLRFLAFLKRNPDWVDEKTLVDYRYFIYKRLADLNRSSARRIKRRLSVQRFFRKPDFRGLLQSLWFRFLGKRKAI